MSQQKDWINITTLDVRNGRYGQFYSGRLGMADLILSPSKNDPNRWVLKVARDDYKSQNQQQGGHQGQQGFQNAQQGQYQQPQQPYGGPEQQQFNEDGVPF